MSKQRQIVVLALEVETAVDFWNWHELLDLNGINESVVVLAFGYEEEDESEQ